MAMYIRYSAGDQHLGVGTHLFQSGGIGLHRQVKQCNMYMILIVNI
jgi:hypothetical protein